MMALKCSHITSPLLREAIVYQIYFEASVTDFNVISLIA